MEELQRLADMLETAIESSNVLRDYALRIYELDDASYFEGKHSAFVQVSNSIHDRISVLKERQSNDRR